MNTSENVEKKSKKKIVGGPFLGYMSLLLSIVTGVFFTPWIIKAISAESYGLYSLSNSLVALFLFDFGLGAAINSFLSRLRAKHDEKGVLQTLAVIYKLYFILDLVVLVAFTVSYFLIDYIYVGLTATEKGELKVIFLITAGFSLISFPASSFNGVIQAYEEFTWLKLTEILNKLLYIVLSATCLILKLGLYSLVISNCVAGLLTILVKYFVIRFKLHVKTKIFQKHGFSVARSILSYSFWSAINALSARLIFNVMPSILGIVSDSQNIAEFSVGASIESYVYSFGSVMSGFFLPKLSRLKEQQESQQKIDALAIKVGKAQLFIIALVEIGFISCGNEFVTLWMNYDERFAASYYGASLIILTQVVFVPELIYYTELFYDEKTLKKLAIVSMIKAGINLVLSFLLGKLWGAMGAFLSIFIARFFEVATHNVLYRKELHADLGLFFKKAFLPLLVPALTSLGIGLLGHFLIDSAYMGAKFLKIGFMVVMVYIGLAAICALSPEEANEMLVLLKSRRK